MQNNKVMNDRHKPLATRSIFTLTHTEHKHTAAHRVRHMQLSLHYSNTVRNSQEERLSQDSFLSNRALLSSSLLQTFMLIIPAMLKLGTACTFMLYHRKYILQALTDAVAGLLNACLHMRKYINIYLEHITSLQGSIDLQQWTYKKSLSMHIFYLNSLKNIQ